MTDADDTFDIQLDSEGHVLGFDPACEVATGWTEDDVAGRRYWDFLVTDDEIETVRDAFRAALAAAPDDAPVPLHHGLRGRGRVVPVDWELRAVRGSDGIVAAVSLAGRPR